MTKTTKRIQLLVLSVLLVTGMLYAVPAYAEQYFDWDIPSLFNRLILMEIHGFSAMAAMFFFGIVYNSHVVRKIKQRQKRRSGLGMVVGMAVLPVTGGLLYYAGSQRVRALSSLVHTGFGLLVFGLAVWHFQKRRLKSNRRESNSSPSGRRPIETRSI